MRANLDLTLDVSLSLSGRAIDAAGQALAGWGIELSKMGEAVDGEPLAVAFSSDQGAFDFPSCNPRSSYRLRLFTPGSSRTVAACALENVQSSGERVELRTVVQGSQLSRLSGNVELQGSIGSKQLEVSGVGISGRLYLTVDPSTGAFESPRLVPGRYRLRTVTPKAGYGPAHYAQLKAQGDLTIQLGSIPLEEVTFHLPQLASSRLEDLARVRLLIRGEDSIVRLSLGTSGTAEARLVPGEYSYSMGFAAGFADCHGSFTVLPDSPMQVHLRLVVGQRARLNVVSHRALAQGETIELKLVTSHATIPLPYDGAPAGGNAKHLLGLGLGLPLDSLAIIASTKNGLRGEIDLRKWDWTNLKLPRLVLASQAFDE